MNLIYKNIPKKQYIMTVVVNPARRNAAIAKNFDRLFEEAFTFDRPARKPGARFPRVNILENGDRFFLEMAVPGLKKSDFELTVEEDRLTISADQQRESEENITVHRREFGKVNFKREFRLPETVATDQITARYEEGVLTIELPKKEEAVEQPPRKVEIA